MTDVNKETTCPLPGCPVGTFQALNVEQHGVMTGHLTRIEGNQRTIDVSIKQVSSGIEAYMGGLQLHMEKISNLVINLDDHKKDAKFLFDEIFGRLRKVEIKQAWFIGIGSGMIGLIELLRALRVF